MLAPFFGAFHALAIDDGGGGAALAFILFAALHKEHIMDASERAVIAPQIEIVERVERGGESFGIARH